MFTFREIRTRREGGQEHIWILHRVIEWTDEAIRCEADQRHGGWITQGLGHDRDMKPIEPNWIHTRTGTKQRKMMTMR